MRIGLLGFTTDHENMGCQALTCSFISILKEVTQNNNLEFIIFGGGSGLGKIPELFPEYKFYECEALLKKPIFIKKIRECDIVFDETYGDGFSDIYFGKEEYKDIIKKIISCFFSKKFVFTPQTYGPFSNKQMEKLAAYVLKKANYVFSRDKISTNYAKKISCRNVMTVTDLAFALPFVKTKRENSIGFNVSGLLWQGGFNEKKNQFSLKTDYKEYCRSMVSFLLEEGYSVHLIPHVTKTINNDRIIPDGDYPACIELHEEFPKTILAPCFETPYEVKNYIASMEMFIGARMHSTIAAFSSEVVTIPFAYSRKFQGLYESLKYKFIIDGKSLITAKAVELTKEYIMNNEVLSKKQKDSMKSVNTQLTLFKEELRSILYNKN